MNKKYKSSRKRMGNRAGSPSGGQTPGASNRARRRIIAAVKRKSDKRKALEPLPTGPTEIVEGVKV